ncbi:MAG TPA: lysylphosphatidylglycerol synthase domain-containing protein [Nevskiaceae bacterium]
MKRGVIIAFVFGLALFIGVLVWRGAGPIMRALEVAGWGMLAVTAWHAVPLLFDSAGQWFALPRAGRRLPRFHTVFRARWVGEAVNALLPVAQVGGLLVMARMIAQRAYTVNAAGAGVTVGTAQQILAQIVFTIVGLLLLLHFAGGSPVAWSLVGAALGFCVLGAWLYRVQRRGMFEPLARFLGKMLGSHGGFELRGGAQALDAAVDAIYTHRARVRASFVAYLLGWIAGFGEIWLALYFLGHPVSWLQAIFFESLGQAVYAMAFFIPGALGIQEGGFVLLGAVIGVPADAAIVLSLIKRVRMLVLGVPGLVSWQWFEGRKLHGPARLGETAPMGDGTSPSAKHCAQPPSRL